MTDQTLTELERSIRTNVRVTTGLVVATVVIVVAGGAYGYWKVRRMLAPDHVAAEAEQYVQAHYPDWRAQLKTELVRSAPKLAERFSHRTLNSIPDARARVEKNLERWTDRGLAHAQDISEDQLRQFVRDHKAEIRDAYADAKKSPEESRAAVKKVEDRLREKYDVNTRHQARAALAWITGFNEHLREIARPTDPSTDEERAERRIARLLRAMEVHGPRPVAAGGGEVVK